MTNTPDTSPEAVERLIAWLMDAHETGNTEKNPYVWRTLRALSAALETERAENLILRQANEGLSSAAWTATTRAEAAEAERDAALELARDKEESADYWHQESRIQFEAKNKAKSERDALKAELAESVEALVVLCQNEIDRGDKNSNPAYAAGARACRNAARAFLARHQKETDT